MTTYSLPVKPVLPTGQRIDQPPAPGFYRYRVKIAGGKGKAWRPAKVYYADPIDDDGRVVDRAPRLAGKRLDERGYVQEFDPFDPQWRTALHPISEGEWAQLVAACENVG